MGQKVNPHGLRVGVIKDWDSGVPTLSGTTISSVIPASSKYSL